MSGFTESVVEEAALAWLEDLGYAVLHGPDIAAGEPRAERSDPNYRDVVLEGRLRQALKRLNPDLPSEALEDAYRKLTRMDAPSLGEGQHTRRPDVVLYVNGLPRAVIELKNSAAENATVWSAYQQLQVSRNRQAGCSTDAPTTSFLEPTERPEGVGITRPISRVRTDLSTIECGAGKGPVNT